MSHASFLCGEPSFYDPTDSTMVPFESAESAWFWCVRASEAIHDGACSGSYINTDWGSRHRPCEAVDIQNVVLRLSRQQILNSRHVRVLSLYGKRRLRPPFASHARTLWHEALHHMTPILQHKGIIIT